MIQSLKPVTATKLNDFLQENRERAIAYLCKKYSQMSSEEAEDYFQEASVELYENICDGKYQEQGSLFSYFMSIYYNVTSNALRKKKMQIVPLKVDISEKNFDDEPLFRQEKVDELSQLIEQADAEQHALEVEARDELIRTCVSQMKEPCNKVLWAYYWDQLSHETIATMYGFASAAVVKTTSNRCRNKFKKFLIENHLL